MPIDGQMLLNLYRDLESERVERKAVFRPLKNKIYETICAFANDLHSRGQAGVIFIGVQDKGACEGGVIDDVLLKEIVDIRGEGKILPFPVISVERRIIDGCEVAAIIVEPSDTPPIWYDGKVFVRIGPTNRKATSEEERILTRRRIYKDFDLQPVKAATLDDLDLLYLREVYIPNAVARSVLQENQRDVKDQLAALRLLTPDYTPTVLGILVAGKDPRYFLPNAYIQFVRCDGLDLTAPIKDQDEISGRIQEVIQRIEDKLLANISIQTDLTTYAVETQHPDYPHLALRELIRNAILHRDYERSNAPVRIQWFNDRIEIHNPGGPYGRVTELNFGQPNVTDYRNPHLAEAMKILGFVQRFGYGIVKTRHDLSNNNNPEPIFEARTDENYVLVTVRKPL